MITVEITTNDGERFIEDVEEFDVESMNQKLNDSEINTVSIGNIILGRYDVKRIVAKIIEKEPTE